MKTLALFLATALAEIVGCYLTYLWLKQGRSIWLLLPAGWPSKMVMVVPNSRPLAWMFHMTQPVELYQ